MNAPLALLVGLGGALFVWAGIANPDGGLTAELRRVLSGRPATPIGTGTAPAAPPAGPPRQPVNAGTPWSTSAGGTIPAILRLAQASGARVTVTSTTGGQHAEGSLHYKSRAVDFGGPPSAVRQLAQHLYGQHKLGAVKLAQLIHQDPETGRKYGVLNGRDFDYGAATYSGHLRHVHVAL